ncbi:MAG TPA: class I SAM-dependent methyltransferase [Yinghuangia sp.]|uniref:SAM-dependent methyltransferase n=1 Tax=Yinghuangia sp. YIM S10712 TaxID=3436930 RepID=UPI002B917F91|nr:class I SAM-dependent methyltransferase [Yinghuangia sp.]
MSQHSDNPVIDAFFALHRGLLRQGPGSDASTRHLLRLAGPLPSRPRILDAGCGPGGSALVLAAEADADLIAVDLHQPFLDELDAEARRRGLADRIRTLNCSMDQLPFPDGHFTVIWAESSVYNIGFDRALRIWRRLLGPDGVLVVTEAEWTTATPSPEARAFWEGQYELRTADRNTAAADAAGYDVAARHPLPEADWWDSYYTPLAARCDAADTGQPGMAEAVAMTRAEIAMRAEHGGDYGYTGYVLRPRREG